MIKQIFSETIPPPQIGCGMPVLLRCMELTALSSESTLSQNFNFIGHFLRKHCMRKIRSTDIPGLHDYAASLNLTPEETVVIALIYQFQESDQRLSHGHLVKLTESLFGSRSDLHEVISMFRKLGPVDKFEANGTENYRINFRTFRSLRNNKTAMLSTLKPVGLERLLEHINEHLLERHRLDEEALETEFEFLSGINPDLNIVKNCFEVLPSLDAFAVVAACTMKYIYDGPLDTSIFKSLFRFDNRIRVLLREITDESFLPIKAGHLRVCGGDLIGEEPEIELTEAGINFYMKEMSEKSKARLLRREKQLPAHATLPTAIPVKKLLFDAHMQVQVRDLEMLVMPDFYRRYLDSLPAGSRMRGLTVLLHGAPGTGKTELALQLARKSKRALFRIDVSQVMSKWVGDSEKNLRAKLREYRHYQKDNPQAPILFLNECDQLLSRRLSVTQSVDQMRNTMQNMLLEELETFEGILMATTNLVTNLDAAFERRFLYKVRFTPPSADLRAQLWKFSIPRLTTEQAAALAARYPLSPGELQNVATKLRLRRMLNPKLRVYDAVEELCREEKWGNETKAMGFMNK